MIGFRFSIGCPDCASELETVTEATPGPALVGAVLRCTECGSEHHIAVTLQRVPKHQWRRPANRRPKAAAQ